MNSGADIEIYFACSIRGGRDDAKTYARLVGHAKKRATVLTEIFADNKLTSAGMNLPDEDIWQTDIGWVRRADAVIAEVTNPSLGVGYEIAKAEEWRKPVLVLFREVGGQRLSAMIGGSPNVEICRYQEVEDAFIAIDEFIQSAKTGTSPGH